MHTRAHTYMPRVHVHIHMHICTQRCMCVYICIHMQVHAGAQIQACTYTHAHTCVHNMCMRKHICIDLHTCMCTHASTCTWTVCAHTRVTVMCIHIETHVHACAHVYINTQSSRTRGEFRSKNIGTCSVQPGLSGLHVPHLLWGSLQTP